MTGHNPQVNGIIVRDFLRDQIYDAHPITESYALLMDRASHHTANVVENLLNEREIEYEYLPPRSADLEPVDCLWKTLKEIVKHEEATDEEWLWNAVQCAEDTMQQRAIKKTIDSMPHFINTVIDLEGHIHAH